MLIFHRYVNFLEFTFMIFPMYGLLICWTSQMLELAVYHLQTIFTLICNLAYTIWEFWQSKEKWELSTIGCKVDPEFLHLCQGMNKQSD
jgi:hypothetical protein